MKAWLRWAMLAVVLAQAALAEDVTTTAQPDTSGTLTISDGAFEPDEIIDSWLERQKSAELDWVRRQLGLPDPYQPPAPTPDDPTPDVGNVTGSGSFLWKPVSENDSKAVVILPCEYRLDSVNDPWRTAPNARVIESITIEGGDRDGDTPRTSYWPEGRNGNRIHSRMSAKGEDYGKGFDVVVVVKGGERKAWRIKDGADRQ